MSVPLDPVATVPRLWTVGHSTLEQAAFIELLRAHGIQGIADVRRTPASRRHPQFGEQALRAALESQGLGYRWLPDLGGRRQPRPDSPNTAWRQPIFRGYADHLQSAAFAGALDALLAYAAERRVAILCAERSWRRCHRGLIADALSLRGVEVIHILDARHVEPHVLNPAVRLVDGRIVYPHPDPSPHQGDLFAPRAEGA